MGRPDKQTLYIHIVSSREFLVLTAFPRAYWASLLLFGETRRNGDFDYANIQILRKVAGVTKVSWLRSMKMKDIFTRDTEVRSVMSSAATLRYTLWCSEQMFIIRSSCVSSCSMLSLLYRVAWNHGSSPSFKLPPHLVQMPRTYSCYLHMRITKYQEKRNAHLRHNAGCGISPGQSTT